MNTPTKAQLVLVGSIGLIVSLTGCASSGVCVVETKDSPCCSSPPTPAPVARIGHVVLLKLKDAADTDELIVASDEALAGIPGLTHYDSGVHLETGRDAVESDYHVALYIGFDTEADYAAYLVHPDHVAYVNAWRPRFESIVIFDVLTSE